MHCLEHSNVNNYSAVTSCLGLSQGEHVFHGRGSLTECSKMLVCQGWEVYPKKWESPRATGILEAVRMRKSGHGK